MGLKGPVVIVHKLDSRAAGLPTARTRFSGHQVGTRERKRLLDFEAPTISDALFIWIHSFSEFLLERPCSLMSENRSAGVRLNSNPGSPPSLALWSHTSYLCSLSLTFLICKMGSSSQLGLREAEPLYLSSVYLFIYLLTYLPISPGFGVFSHGIWLNSFCKVLAFFSNAGTWDLQSRQTDVSREEQGRVGSHGHEEEPTKTNLNPCSRRLQLQWSGCPAREAVPLHHTAKHTPDTRKCRAEGGSRGRWSSCKTHSCPTPTCHVQE